MKSLFGWLRPRGWEPDLETGRWRRWNGRQFEFEPMTPEERECVIQMWQIR